jgi:predicted metalloprotease
MRWTPGGGSSDVEDIRGQGGRRVGLPMAIGGGGGVIGLVVFLLVTFLGGGDGGGSGYNLPTNLDRFPAASGASGAPLPGAPDPDGKTKEFVSFVLDDLQSFWTDQFRDSERTYQRAKLVLFTDAVRSGCGGATAESGPFYCSGDTRVYIDLGFYRDLARKYDAPGDFAQAYVIAHEIGHHVQHLLGTSDRVHEEQQRSPGDANDLSVRLELQADCLAGVWSHSTYERGLLEEGDLQEALDAASGVGDDRLQKQATGRVNPDSFTHGTSAQRSKWFKRGFDSGRPDQCDTFGGDI